ncbi:MAG TPA: hypothetical protein VJ891_13375 [Casimicrobiaceae bacterium]|nr:hypothetical protein [Casimicrobiaceae bacterium]
MTGARGFHIALGAKKIVLRFGVFLAQAPERIARRVATPESPLGDRLRDTRIALRLRKKERLDSLARFGLRLGHFEHELKVRTLALALAALAPGHHQGWVDPDRAGRAVETQPALTEVLEDVEARLRSEKRIVGIPTALGRGLFGQPCTS